MDTSALMSSLREMVTADVHVQMINSGVLTASEEVANGWREQYTLHETVVRTHLDELGRVAAAYKEPLRF